MNWAVVREPTILTTAAVYGLLATIAVGVWIFGLFGLWLGILLFISLWRYCYSVLRAVAQGHKRIPPLDADSVSLFGEWSVFWHFVTFPGLVLVTAPYQPLGAVVAILAAIAFPASAALMGLTSSLAHAFRPGALIAFVRIVGSVYAVLVVGNVVIVGGAFLIIFIVAPELGMLPLMFSLTIEIWALLASFALIGSVLRAHRLDFDIPGEVVPRAEQLLKRQHTEWRKVLDIAYGSFRSGVLAAGYKTLHEFVDANDDSLEVNHWLVENMLEWRDKRFALEVAARLMPRLIARGDIAGALDLYRLCRRHDPDYRPGAAEAEQLAAHAEAVGQTGLANELSYNREPN